MAEPWGTPRVITMSSDLILTTETCCLLLYKQLYKKYKPVKKNFKLNLVLEFILFPQSKGIYKWFRRHEAFNAQYICIFKRTTI